MSCKCDALDKLKGEKLDEIIQQHLVQLKVDGFKYKTLYICKYCRVFWEERNTEDRYFGEPYLVKVTENYVSINWGTQFLER
ncbi:MAG: hypothetical protein PHD60_11670 [Clostridia bacterium]|nr:hypothetical protein [Clostridia bacterium]